VEMGAMPVPAVWLVLMSLSAKSPWIVSMKPGPSGVWDDGCAWRIDVSQTCVARRAVVVTVCVNP